MCVADATVTLASRVLAPDRPGGHGDNPNTNFRFGHVHE